MATPRAYVDRDDPSIVVVCGVGFSAIRVGGVWKPSVQTVGDLNEHFRPLPEHEAVALFMSAARALGVALSK